MTIATGTKLGRYEIRSKIGDSLIKGYLALVLARSGQREEARKLLNELKLESTRRYVTSYGLRLLTSDLMKKRKH